MNRRLKIGLLVDGNIVPKYVHDVVAWAGRQASLDFSHLIIRGGSGQEASGRADLRGLAQPSGAVQSLLWWLVNRYEALRVRRRGRLAATLRLHDISGLVEGRIAVPHEPSGARIGHRLSKEDVARIRQEEFDLLVHGGSGILEGEILQAARLGVLSFHHGDNRHYRGGPPGFWEVYRQDPRTGFTLQILGEEPDGGQVLSRGNFPTQAYYLANAKILQERASQYLKNLLLAIASTGSLPSPEASVPYCGPLYGDPGALQLLRYIGMQVLRSLRGTWYRQARIRDRWHVAFSATHWRDTVLRRGIRIADPPGRFLADPFVLDTGKAAYCFVEDYSYQTGKGIISAFEIHEAGARYAGLVIEEPYHLSFPFLFRFEGALYMCPETAAAGEIRVYRCRSLPLEWELAAVPMKGVNAADTMLFEARGRWWMLANLDSSEISDRCAELHLFHSDSPLSSSWTPHPMNPLIVDSGRARNGGLILDGGRIFRVAQVHGGADQYGVGAQVFEITRIDETHYEDRLVCALTPTFAPGVNGIHHMHSDGRFTAWDFRTRERVP